MKDNRMALLCDNMQRPTHFDRQIYNANYNMASCKMNTYPVTGSQPAEASNPLVLQPGLLPEVTSLKMDGFWYRKGLRKPRGDLPAAMRASFYQKWGEIDNATGIMQQK